tara:strand:+ start:19524 stop:20102 length:579 start_codon:yes stop_codon:yes gene_type:complete
MQWYYLDENQRQVEASEADLHDLRMRRVITDQTMIWNETLPEWVEMGRALPMQLGQYEEPTKEELEELINPLATAAEKHPPANSSDTRVYASVVAQSAGWMKFLGILGIINGVLLCLTLIGAVVGWIPIWMGRMLVSSANSAQDAQSTGSRFEMTDSLEKMTKVLKVSAVLTLLGIILAIIGGIVALVIQVG